MSNTPHELADAFPDHRDILHTLKLHHARFATLSARYHEINRDIHRIEVEVEPASDARVEGLKKERLSLLDEVAKIIHAQQAASA